LGSYSGLARLGQNIFSKSYKNIKWMDKALYSLGHKTLGYDAEYDFFLQTILVYFKSPNSFKIASRMSFEDIMATEY
jgi:hypothetical protein